MIYLIIMMNITTNVNEIDAVYLLQGPVVRSIVSLTSSLVVKMLTVLVRIISDSQVFLLKK